MNPNLEKERMRAAGVSDFAYRRSQELEKEKHQKQPKKNEFDKYYDEYKKFRNNHTWKILLGDLMARSFIPHSKLGRSLGG